MSKALRITGVVMIAFMLFASVSGCLNTVKNKVGENLEDQGKNTMDNNVGEDTSETSILHDIVVLVTGVFSGEKDWNSLFMYFLGLAFFAVGQYLKGKKFAKQVAKEGEIKDKGLELVTDVIQRFMTGRMSVAVPEGANGDAAKIVAAEIAKAVEIKSGSKNSEIGAVIHNAVSKVKAKASN